MAHQPPTQAGKAGQDGSAQEEHFIRASVLGSSSLTFSRGFLDTGINFPRTIANTELRLGINMRWRVKTI